MFSFFKRSKSQKGKQKHDQKLQLPPEEQQLQTACGEPKPQGTARKESTGSVCLGANDGVKPSVDVSKVAADANAGANGWRRPPAVGDEEKLARAKNNNNPPGPQPAAGVDRLPSRCLGGKPGGVTDVALEREPPSAASVSPSGPTCRSGRVPNNDNDSPNETRAARDEFFPPIDSDEDGAGDRESSSPIDDSRHWERGTQANATSSNPYAPPSESAMAKGRNRRRYQPQQQQVKAQQQQQHQQQQQQEHQNALRRGDSSGAPEGKKGVPPTHLSLGKPMTTIVLVDQATIEPLTNGDVIIERSPKEQAMTEKAEPMPSTDSCDRAAKTHTANGGVGAGELVTPCADSPPKVTATTGDGVGGGTNTRSAPALNDGDALLNIKNISPTTTAKEQQQERGEDHDGVDGIRDGDLRARELGLALHVGSCEPAAKPTISKQTTDAVVANGSVEEALAIAVEEAVADTTIQEMGQQPSRAESEVQQRSSAGRASKSISPQRVVPAAAPSPPPRTPRSVVSPGDLEAIARNATITTIERDAAGDDTSDDRDVFYEAKETLSPPIVAPGEPRFESGAVVTPGTPEPIRGSLVLKIGPEPTTQQQQQQPVNATPRRADRHKKQVSFKLTQNGSDDVEVTSVEGSSDEEEDGDSDSERERVLCAVPPTSTPSEFTNSEFTHNNHTAFSESNNSKPPTAFGICSLGAGEPVANQRNYIEFKYDNSAPSDTSASAESEKKSPGKDVHEGVGATPAGKERHLVNGEPQQTSVSVLIEDSVASLPDVVQQPTGIEPHGKTILPPTSFSTVEKINSEMKDLVNQECRYSAKLEEAEKRVNEANAKVYELQQKLDAVERDALLKEYNVERLQAELVAALKECEGIRARLTTQQSEMEAIRLQASEREDELNLRYQNLEVEHLELNEKLKEVRHLAHDLNSQLIDAKSEVDRLKEERQKLLDARTEEQKIMREALEESIQQRAQVEAKWKHDFEQLRNVNNDREEHLMKDCEFTVRNMQKTCKEKVETADRERKQALEKVGRLEEQTRRQSDEMRHLKSVEAEVEQLRGLTYDQKEALASMTRQVEGLKAELETAYNRLEEEMVKVQQIKNRCEYQLCEKEREALNRIEIARGEIAMQWEDRLLHEMNRLKVELEQMHMEERKSAIEKIQRETLAETEALSQRFNAREQQLKNEIESLKATVELQKSAMANAQSEADQKLIQSRMYVERAEREHEQKLAKEMDEKNEIIDNLKRQFEQEKLRLEQHFTDRIQQVQEEFAREISDTTEMMKSVHKKELENQWKALVAEKEEALQLMDSRNRNRLEDAENKIRDLTTGHQRQLKDLQDEHSFVVHSLESRDTKNAQEIQTLHKKCRCLTNLFEEMRLRYERRESRPEDLQQIEELKRVIDSQDRDLRLLTETLRELQLEQMQKQRQQPKPQAPQQQQQPPPPPRRSKPNRGKQSKQQQQQQNRPQQHKQQQQKNTRPPHPPPEPEPVQPEADAQQEEEECHEVEEVVVGYGQPSAPQVVLIPPPQFIPPGMIHRTMCDVIYEENEADILREEEEAQLNAGQEGEEEVEDSEDEEAGDVEQEDDEETEVLVVDVPESAIQTEDRVIQSTAPTIIEEIDPMPEQREDHVGGDGIPQFTVVPIETIDDATSARPRASSTPRIVITVDDTEKETGETVVEITEEPSTCATPVIELPAVFAKIYPSELPPQAAAAGDSGATHSEPEMTVIRTSGEGHGEGSA